MWLRLLILAALWVWPSLAFSARPAAVAGLFETKTQVFEGTFALRQSTTANGIVITIERRHIGASDCNPCRLIPDPPAFLSVDRIIKDEPGHPLHNAMEQRDWGAPAPPSEGTRVRVFIQGGFWTLICALNSEAPSTPSCERSNKQLSAWQSVQEQISTTTRQSNTDALLHLAETLEKTDPYSAVRALYGAMDHGALVPAGSRASEILIAQANYPEAIAVLDRMIAAQGPAASPDMIARRELARAVCGHQFDASKVDFSHLTLSNVHLGPVTLTDRAFDGMDWRDVHIDHVDFSGLRSNGLRIEHGTLDHVSFHGASAAVAAPLSDEGGRAGRALVVPPDWDGKSPVPTLHDVVNNAQGTAITAFALQLTLSTFSLHASIVDGDFANANLPYAEINGTRGGFYRPGEAATQRTTFDGSNLEAAGFGGHLDHISFKDAKLDWAEFTQATLDHVSFEGASLAGTEFSVVHFRGVDFSHAKLWQSDPTVEGVVHRLDKNLIVDRILGLRFDPETFGRSTYDCATKWPPGFDPTLYGLIPTQSSCVSRQSLDFDGLTMHGLNVGEGLDLSGATFRGANLQVACQGGSLRGADFTNAQFSGWAGGCDLTNALFQHASISATLVGATLTGTQFIDSTIDANAIASFPFGGFWTSRPPDPSQRTFTDFPGATFLRSRLACTVPSYSTIDSMFHHGNEEQVVAAFRALEQRGLVMDESCRKAFPAL